jgi:hypothetical protein
MRHNYSVKRTPGSRFCSSRRLQPAPLTSGVRAKQMTIRRLSAALVLFGLPIVAWAGQGSLCTTTERVIFSCHTGPKTISVCASKHFTLHSGYVQYRFGSHQGIELRYPKSRIPPNGHFYYHDTGYSRGWIDHLSFKNGGYKYIVYERFLWDGDVYGDDHHTSTSGIVVVAPNGSESNLRCNSQKFRKFGPEVQVLQRDDFYPYKG